MKNLLAAALAAALFAGCGSTATAPTPQALVAAPTPAPTAAPTPVPTPVPTPTPVPPITLEEIEAAVAAEDCMAILAIGTDERIEATDDPEVLMAGIDATGRCLTGEYVEPVTLVKRGEPARVGDWDVKVTGKVNFDAWKKVKAENMFNDPAPKGWKMVLVPLAFTNRGAEKASLLGLGEYVVGDGTLIERTDFDDPTCGVIPNELDFFTDVRPGGTLKGNLCFVVDKDDIETLRLGIPQGMFSDGEDTEFALR